MYCKLKIISVIMVVMLINVLSSCSNTTNTDANLDITSPAKTTIISETTTIPETTVEETTLQVTTTVTNKTQNNNPTKTQNNTPAPTQPKVTQPKTTKAPVTQPPATQAPTQAPKPTIDQNRILQAGFDKMAELGIPRDSSLNKTNSCWDSSTQSDTYGWETEQQAIDYLNRKIAEFKGYAYAMNIIMESYQYEGQTYYDYTIVFLAR